MMTDDTLFMASPDELERLRTENAKLIHNIQAPDGYTWEWHWEQQQEELERLRDIIDQSSAAWLSLDPPVRWVGDLTAAVQAGIEEIKRLRNELAVEKGWVSQYRNAYAEQAGDIERLRNENDNLRRGAASE